MKMYGYAYSILRNQQEAEDVVQEIFLKLWKLNTRLDSYNSIEALAMTMIRNYCIDTLRKAKNESDHNMTHEVIDTRPDISPYENMVRNENKRLLTELIDRLPEQLSKLIRLHDLDGLSYEEIAGSEGMNINTIRVSISRARKMIRDEFKRQGYEK
jgi:RNA polymerase sigma-70 factor (ECF subfamily)